MTLCDAFFMLYGAFPKICDSVAVIEIIQQSDIVKRHCMPGRHWSSQDDIGPHVKSPRKSKTGPIRALMKGEEMGATFTLKTKTKRVGGRYARDKSSLWEQLKYEQTMSTVASFPHPTFPPSNRPTLIDLYSHTCTPRRECRMPPLRSPLLSRGPPARPLIPMGAVLHTRATVK
jgi:hypothetical protein